MKLALQPSNQCIGNLNCGKFFFSRNRGGFNFPIQWTFCCLRKANNNRVGGATQTTCQDSPAWHKNVHYETQKKGRCRALLWLDKCRARGSFVYEWINENEKKTCRNIAEPKNYLERSSLLSCLQIYTVLQFISFPVERASARLRTQSLHWLINLYLTSTC